MYCFDVQANILSAALNHLMTEAGREYVSRLDKYWKEFNPHFGHKGFEKFFSLEGCGQGFIP